MVPIPMKDRVYNKTGIQCVWASLECIGRYAEEKKLINLTNDSECQGYSSPSGSARKLIALNVKFEQTTSLSDKSLIRKAVVKEKRGVLFGIPGHAMVMVHYDEAKGIIKYINNGSKELYSFSKMILFSTITFLCRFYFLVYWRFIITNCLKCSRTIHGREHIMRIGSNVRNANIKIFRFFR